MRGFEWPDHWQPRAREVITQALGSDLRLRIVVGDPAASIDGTVLEGLVQLNGRKVMVAYDHGADGVPWRLLAARYFGSIISGRGGGRWFCSPTNDGHHAEVNDLGRPAVGTSRPGAQRHTAAR